MKTTNKITLALGLLTAAASNAQTTTTTAPGGVLGQQYTEVSFGLGDVKHISTHGYSLNASANTPLIPGKLDAGGTYSYSWIGGPFRGHANTVGGYATAYAPLQGVKPFLGAALGYQWTSARFNGGEEQALWGATAGLEIPMGVITLTPRINYADDFEGSRTSSQAWTIAVEANYWVNKTTAIFASIGKTDVRHSRFDSRNYEVGLRARF